MDNDILGSIITRLNELLVKLEDMPRRLLIRANQIIIYEGLSDVTESLGTISAGEFRVGTGQPGQGFYGMRIAYPPLIYNSTEWNLVGVDNDSLQVGIRASDGKLLAGGGNVILDSSGITVGTSPSITMSGTDIRSGNYVAETSGFIIKTTGNAEFNDVSVRGTLRSNVFEYKTVGGVSGTLLITKSSGVLLSDVTLAAGASTCSLFIEDPTYGHAQLFVVDDMLNITSGGTSYLFRVTAIVDNTYYYAYVCSVISTIVTPVTFTKSQAVIDFGKAGGGYLELTADHTNSPRYSVHLLGAGTGEYPTQEIIRIGNLNNILDYTSEKYGIVIGGQESFMAYDPDDGLRVRGIVQATNEYTRGYDVFMEQILPAYIDGVSSEFMLENSYITGSLFVFINGVGYFSTADYSTPTISSDKFQLEIAPETGDSLTVTYRNESNGDVVQEIPTGLVNGVNKLYTLAHTPVASSVCVFINGVATSPDDVEVGAQRFKLSFVPESGDDIRACYSIFDNDWVREALVGTANGINTVFSITSSAINLHVYVNGVAMIENIDYTISSTTITFTSAPWADDILFAEYYPA